MQEHPLLAAFARLLADFVGNPGHEDPLVLEALLDQCARALLQGQTPASLRDTFEFERIQYFTTQYLKPVERKSLEERLFRLEQNIAGEPPVQVFLREMPNRVNWLRSSIPQWALAAELSECIGPVTNRDGRRFWLDVYKSPERTKEFRFFNAVQPSILFGPDAPVGISFNHANNWFRAVTLVEMGEGTVWVQAKLFNATAEANQYCGIRVIGASLSFPGWPSDDVAVVGDEELVALILQELMEQKTGVFQMIHDATVKASLTLKIAPAAQHPAVGIYGADARNANVQLPESLVLDFNQTTSALQIVSGSASWNVYGDPKTMTWTGEQPAYENFFNAIAIPMLADTTNFVVSQRESPVWGLGGATKIDSAAWLLPAAKLGVPLRAEGAGMLLGKTGSGLSATCSGLLDANGVAIARLQLDECFVAASPQTIQVISWKASTEYAMQRFRLWQGAENFWNDVNLSYKDKFPFLYQCDVGGIETIAAIAACAGNLDRPVGADGQPFELQTKFALMIRAFAEIQDYIVIFDENVLRDNTIGAAAPVFQSKAIALNNALMTVSPVNSFLLSGQLPPTADTFLDASLVYAFALLGYLPTLPDPYAANTGIFQWTQERQGEEHGIFTLEQIQRLLVASLRWKTSELPTVRFIFGDLEQAANNLPVRLNPLLNVNLALDRKEATRRTRSEKAAKRIQQRTNVQAVRSDFYDLNLQVNDQYQHHRFFSLLDVSTAADWMGVDVGTIDDRFFFERSFAVRDDQNPLSAEGMDVVASGRFVRLFTVPQISWEPVTNITPPFNVNNDPPIGILTFQDDGPPTLIGNTGQEPVAIAPLPLAFYLAEKFNSDLDFKAWSFFTLPFGMLGIARYNQEVPGMGDPTGATLELLQQKFPKGIQSALQISTVGYQHPQGNRTFEGVTEQLVNLYNAQGAPLDRSILSRTVTDIFNGEFGASGNAGKLRTRGVPVERYDFSGYGANLFSHWLNPEAKIGQTSQAKFDVWSGRTAQEVVQVRSLIYPWRIHVVRTITMFRNSAGMVYRVDSGWRAESDGNYDFKAIVKDPVTKKPIEVPAYTFHPGIVRGVYDVRNIVETSEITPFFKNWKKTEGYYVNPNTGLMEEVGPAGQDLFVWLTPVYFDADVQMDDVVSGAVQERVPSKRMLGYLQISPQGIVISPEDFAELLLLQNGLGGPVDCGVNINKSNQNMRISRVEVQPSRDAANNLVFVTAAKGMPVLPKTGSWSVVQHRKANGDVVPISDPVVPLTRRGVLGQPTNEPLEIASPTDLFNTNLETRATQYAFLQNTDTQKVLYRNPFFEEGKKVLQSSLPDFADAYRLLDSKGIFPKLDKLPRLDFTGFDVNIEEGGFQLLNTLDPVKAFQQEMPAGPIYFVNEKEVKIYVEYAAKDKSGDGALRYDLNSTPQWASKISDVTMVVDLLDMKRLFLIKGKFDTEKGKTPAFTGPELGFGPDLQPVYEVLRILMLLDGDDYAGALTQGLKIAMSNSPNNWEYKFQADKEIPVLRFPPPRLDNPGAPLRLECYLKLGCYFNVGMPLPSGEGMPVPSGGGYVEFGAKLSVMCLSVAAATVYAVGTCVLRIGADTVRGPSLAMKMGFGVELMVGLPVIGNVSVYFAAGVEISVDTRIIVVGAFILFRGRAELIGGLVTIQIQIEASGKIVRDNAEKRTDCVATVTFSLDISIFLVINISFSKSFQENRQIA